MNFLLLDDDEHFGALLRLKFHELGLTSNIVHASKFEEAVDYLKEYSFDLCFLDHRLQVKDGLDFVIETNLSIPFIYLSFYLTQETIEKVRELGGVTFDKNDLIMNFPKFVSCMREYGNFTREQF